MSGYRRHSESFFFLEEKQYESKSKFLQKLHFIDSPLRVKCMVLELAKLQNTRNDTKTSAQVGLEQQILYR